MEISTKEFNLLSILIKNKVGVNLKENKKNLVVLRLSRRLDALNLKSFESYYNLLLQDKEGSEIHYFIDSLTTHYTYFLREEVQFKFFSEVVLPNVCSFINDGDLRIWSAASSTGEEPYSIAMILDEYFGSERIYWNKEVLATDIARKVIKSAMEGLFLEQDMDKIPKYWLVNYFEKKDKSRYMVKKFIKDQVTFRCFNLLETFYPFKKKFHVIFCRNVLIYFDKETKKEVISKLVDCLELNGYLFLGLSESINYKDFGLTYVQPSIYRKDIYNSNEY